MTVVISLVLVCAAAVAGWYVRSLRRKVDEPGDAVAAALPGDSVAPDTDTDATRQGVRAFMRGDYAAAFPLLEPAATSGHLKAQILLSKMYFAGHGVKRDRQQYVYWLTRAAENGDKPSKAKLKKLESAG